MLTLRKADDRGHTEWNWLDSRHTFSFGEYYDPAHMSFRHLRVINDDIINPAAGFPTHPHRDMEIISFALEGALEHKDSLGNGSVILPGEIQKMTAGTGIEHSEFNPSDSKRAHFLQIWIFPDEKNLTPSYEQKTIDYSKAENRFLLIGSKEGTTDGIMIHQDVNVYVACFDKNYELTHPTDSNRHYWLQLTRGEIICNDIKLAAGDGLGISHESVFSIVSTEQSELLLFDLS